MHFLVEPGILSRRGHSCLRREFAFPAIGVRGLPYGFPRTGRKGMGMPSVGKVPSGDSPSQVSRSPLSSQASFFRHLTNCKMSNAPREHRVFVARRAPGGKCAMLACRSRGDLSAECGFCLTGACEREARAQGEAGSVSHRGFRLSFCFLCGRAFPASNRKICGKKHAGIPSSGRILPGMRTKIRRHADNYATPCGEKKCLLRQTARALAENKGRFCGNSC